MSNTHELVRNTLVLSTSNNLAKKVRDAYRRYFKDKKLDFKISDIRTVKLALKSFHKERPSLVFVNLYVGGWAEFVKAIIRLGFDRQKIILAGSELEIPEELKSYGFTILLWRGVPLFQQISNFLTRVGVER